MGGGDPTAFAVRGEIDLATAPELATVFGELLQDGHRHVSLDLSAVEFIDSSGLHVLAKTRASLREVGGYLLLSAVSRPVASAIKLSGIDHLLPVPNDVAQARLEDD